jgi:Protein of unknown function (DUF664)
MDEIARVEEPPDGAELDVLVGWLRFHRDALRAKAAGLTPEQLTTRAAAPAVLTILGLVRHLAEMERVYGAWAIGGTGPLTFVWGEYTDDGPEWDFEVAPEMTEASLAAWREGCAATDRALAEAGSPALALDAVGTGNGRTVRWNLHKLVGEYARHNGHADIVRQLIDGATGE